MVVYQNATNNQFSILRVLVFKEQCNAYVKGKGGGSWFYHLATDTHRFHVKVWGGDKVYAPVEPLEVL